MPKENISVKYIKYLGDVKPLDDFVDSNGRSDEELLQAVIKFYEKSSKQIGKERTEIYRKILNVTPKSVTIGKMHGRWGSCSSNKEITYNYLIATLPMDLIDCIVVHELCHIYHMNHSRSFWRKVGSVMPDYKEKMERLNQSVG
ncbi:MAG: M48 family metallopeptidase [Clostridium sp.]